MAIHSMQNLMLSLPNISIESIRDVSGQFVTPQNTETIPQAAQRPIGSPNIGARKLPSVAPTNNVGTISPPLNPPPRVIAVNIILRRKAHQTLCVTKLLAITSPPAPR